MVRQSRWLPAKDSPGRPRDGGGGHLEIKGYRSDAHPHYTLQELFNIGQGEDRIRDNTHTHTHTHTLSAEFPRVFDIRNATAWCISAIVKTSANPARRLKCRIYLADIGDIKEGQGQQ